MTSLQRIKIKLTGKAFVGYKKKAGWRRPLPFYVFKCLIHGYVEDYPHGYRERLECPLCIQEDLDVLNAVEEEAIITEIDQTQIIPNETFTP